MTGHYLYRSTLLRTAAARRSLGFTGVISMLACAPVLSAPCASAQSLDLQNLDAATKSAQSAGDNAWMLASAALVLMMTGPGLALFYGGLVRKKNILATMMQSFAMMVIITILWAIVGYSLAFGEGTRFIGDLRYLFLSGVDTAPNVDYAATIPQLTFMVYQLMFAIITPALITGAFAERMKFSAMVLFMTLWSLIVYLPMAHMVWGKGGLLNAFLEVRFPAWTSREAPWSTSPQAFPPLFVLFILAKDLAIQPA